MTLPKTQGTGIIYIAAAIPQVSSLQGWANKYTRVIIQAKFSAPSIINQSLVWMSSDGKSVGIVKSYMTIEFSDI